MQDQKKIFLYVKTSPLGLKYLGKTTRDPFIYMGSGKRWLKHCDKHNLKATDIKTEILFESTKTEEIRDKGIYYSNLWDIVSSREWANLMPERCDGGDASRLNTPEAKMKHLIPILQYSKEGSFIKEWSSIKEAREFYNVNGSDISHACKGKHMTIKGFIWLYKKDKDKLSERLDKIRTYKPTSNIKGTKGKCKSIIQYDMNEVLIKEWSSIKDAADDLKIERSSISRACSGHNITSSGFKWKYKNNQKLGTELSEQN